VDQADKSKPPFDAISHETPITDFSELKVRGIRYRSELNRVEAINITKAVSRYLIGPLTPAEAPFDYAWFLQLHREMFDDVWGWAGRLRQSQTSIGVRPRFIEQKLFELTRSLHTWKESRLEQAARLHFEAVAIHPFENGNGRWSRLLANLWLYLHDGLITYWPGTELSQESAIRADYIKAIKAADKGDLAPLLFLHQRFTRIEDA
jgi:fido (protein-threonine AMPylation protein)